MANEYSLHRKTGPFFSIGDGKGSNITLENGTLIVSGNVDAVILHKYEKGILEKMIKLLVILPNEMINERAYVSLEMKRIINGGKVTQEALIKLNKIYKGVKQ